MQKTLSRDSRLKKIVLLFMTSWLIAPVFTIASCKTEETDNGTITSETIGEAITTVTMPGGADSAEKEPAALSSAVPQYGGTINLALTAEPEFNLLAIDAAIPQLHVHEKLFEGDWTKGQAGGYGEKLTVWSQSTNIPELNTGYLASDYSWSVSDDGTEVTTRFILREGTTFAKPETEAGELVGGRELTVNDLIWNMNYRLQNGNARFYQLYPAFRYPRAIETGSHSFSITFKIEDHLKGLMMLNRATSVFAPELYEAYGYEAGTDINYSVGTGPYMLKNYVPKTMVILEKNPDYRRTDPLGPGTNNRLPYIDKVKYIIMTDESVRRAAFRTGKLDQIDDVALDEKEKINGMVPTAVSAKRGSRNVTPLFMNTSVAPFNDIRVRKALMMATDFHAINRNLYDGLGDIISWPYYRVAGYEKLFVSPEDSDLPARVRELYTYNPAKAKQLLSEAGFPDGFKTALILEESDIEYYRMLASQWEKVGVQVELRKMDLGAIVSTAATVSYNGMITVYPSPNSTFPEQLQYSTRSWANASLINEPYIDGQAAAVKILAVTDFQASMELCRPLVMHLLEQAYMIPTPRYPVYTMWWPWLKNYSGEKSVGYYPGNSWVHWCWLDQKLKTSMGY